VQSIEVQEGYVSPPKLKYPTGRGGSHPDAITGFAKGLQVVPSGHPHFPEMPNPSKTHVLGCESVDPVCPQHPAMTSWSSVSLAVAQIVVAGL
jgi:hypothetical protein